MAWNEPGGGGGKDPWGGNSGGGGGSNGGGNDKGPPDLDEVLKNMQSKLGGILGGKGKGGGGGNQFSAGPEGKAALVLGAVVLLALAIYNSIYIIDPAERGVITRFGAYHRTTEPGPHLKLPSPIESLTKINVDQNRTISLRSQTVLTRDENLVVIDLTVQYSIKEAENYLFRVKDPDASLQQVAESAIREVIGENDMDFIILQGRNEIAAITNTRIQDVLDRYNTGILVTSVNFEKAQPPEAVQAAFDDANKAREDKERLINEAEAYANGVVPIARGDARRLQEEAKAYRTRVVKSAEGESTRFTKLLAEYQKAPEVTRDRLYLDAMETVLGNSSKVLMNNEGSGNSLMYLPIDRLIGNQNGQQSGLERRDMNLPMVPSSTFETPALPPRTDNLRSNSRSRSREIR